MTSNSQLVEALKNRTLILFVGADLPETITGRPSRADLARGLAERHGVAETQSLAQVAQRVSRAGHRFDFTDYLRRELDTAGTPIPTFYRNLAAFVQAHDVPAIITTAYHDQLERALRDAGVPFDRIVRGSDVAFARPNRLALIKLYGDVQLPDTLVVTEDDHFGLGRNRDKEDVLDEVLALLKKQTVLFLGYNLGDPDFHLLWREVLDRLGRFARTAYAVWPGLLEDEQRVWRDRSIRVLETAPWGLLSSQNAGMDPHKTETPELPEQHTDFDQRGQQVDTQINVAGDYHAPPVQSIHITGDGNVVGDHSSSHVEKSGSADTAEPGQPNTALLRRRLRRLDSVEIESLCLDHFPQVYDKFARGLQRGEMMNLLLAHCRHHPEDAERLNNLLK
ncbi:MAG: SIR2 family protein [Chloroflexota bacterium]|nr:SIR2 family protein [Chloroflexota bacterium]